MLRPMTVRITCGAFKAITTKFRGEHTVTVVTTTITDDVTGVVINREVTHFAEKDTITIPAFYDKKE